jgi:glycine dehydrogenase subunit 1
VHIRRAGDIQHLHEPGLVRLASDDLPRNLGLEGLRELAWQNVQKAAYAADAVEAVRGARKRFAGPVFNEFVVEFSKPWPAVDTALRTKGILAGLPLERDYPELSNTALICVTELRSKEEIDRLAQALKDVLR